LIVTSNKHFRQLGLPFYFIWKNKEKSTMSLLSKARPRPFFHTQQPPVQNATASTAAAAINRNTSTRQAPPPKDASAISKKILFFQDDDIDVEKAIFKKSPSSSSSSPSPLLRNSTSSSLRDQLAISSTEFTVKQNTAKQQEKDDEEGSRSNDGSTATSSNARLALQSTCLVTSMILLLGTAVSGAFLGLGISSAATTQQDQFQRMAVDLTNKIEGAWADYVVAAGTIHGRCRGRNFTRADFRDLYEYLLGGGLSFQAAQFDPNITRDQRAAAEAEARAYYQANYPEVNYLGFVGLEYANSTTLEPRPQEDFYFPIHYMEPIPGNVMAIDLDYHSSGSRRQTVMYCINNGRPALTDRLRLVQEKDASSYGVVLMHPGYNLTTQTDVWPRDLASIVIRIPDLLSRATQNQGEGGSVYLFDQSDSSGAPIFLGAVKITPVIQGLRGSADLFFLPELTLPELQAQKNAYYHQDNVPIANKIWTIVVLSDDTYFKPDYTFVIVGGAIIFVASVFLSIWVCHNTQRVARLNRLKAEAEAERAALIVDNAKQAAKAERELNDFIAHEIRNPVSAAISACSFVKAAVNRPHPLQDEESRETTREDVRIIDNALKFVNDLLRNMLDMHRAANKQLKVSLAPTDILHDVLEPTASILTQRGGKVDVTIDCPKNLFVMSDRLRLKQVVLNLGRNSSKFVDEGFIRLTAKPVGETVLITVEDSGPGIPLEKRKSLFKKYQESLDMLCQGTGIGLFLCMNLVELMGGTISLDESYDSGIPGQRGARFVVDLRQPPIDAANPESLDGYVKNMDGESGGTDPVSDEEERLVHSHHLDLPSKLSVLFVDDDPILRKLFARTVKTVCPEWNIREASNGETALQLVETDHFDLIFMDMYMASIEKQLLGTETVRELRARGVACRICGLSANDKESEFLDAGADAFTFKPFPCEPVALRQELGRVLHTPTDGMSASNERDGEHRVRIAEHPTIAEPAVANHAID